MRLPCLSPTVTEKMQIKNHGNVLLSFSLRRLTEEKEKAFLIPFSITLQPFLRKPEDFRDKLFFNI